MPSLRALLLVSVGLVVLLLAALLAAPGFIDWRAAKPRLEAELSHALGRDVAVDGDLSLYFLPRPWVMAEGLRIANRAEGSEPELLRVASLEMRVALWPLLSGRFEVESLRLLRPVLLLEHLADGSGNWNGMTTQGLLGSPAQADAVSLTSVEMRDGELIWRDHVAGREERLRGLDAQLSAESLRGPLSGQGRFRYQGQPFTFDLALGAPDQRARQSLRLQLVLPEAGDADLLLTGRFSRGEGGQRFDGPGFDGPGFDGPRFDGQAVLAAPEASALLRAFTSAEPPGIDLARELTAQSAVAWADGEVALEGLEVGFADMRLEGAARLRPEAAAAFDLQLSARFLNLDPLLEPGALEWPRLALPPQLGGAFALTIERLLWRDQSLKALELEARVEKGELLIDRAAVELPGGGSAAAGGRLGLSPQSPGFHGHLTAASPNLRAQLAWLGHDLDFVASDRLRRFWMEATLEAKPDLVRLADLQLELDRMRLRGGVALAVRKRPGLGVRLSVDQADLDAYLDPLELQYGELLGLFDANLELEAGSLLLAGRRAEGVQLVASLQDGLLHVEDLQVADLGGARFAASGEVERLGEAWPGLREGRVRLSVADTHRFLQEFNLETPALLRRLGSFQVEGDVEAEGQEARLRLKLAALGGAGDLLLVLENEDAGLRVRDGRLELRSFSFTALEDLTVNEALASEAGNLTVNFGGDGERLMHKSRLEIAQGVLALEGALEAPWSTAPELRGDLHLQHPDAERLTQLFWPEAVQWPTGEVELEARLAAAPDMLRVEELEGRVGDLVLSGSLQGRRGSAAGLDLELSLGEVSAATLAAVAEEISPVARWRDPQGRWSRAPLRRSIFEGPDLDLRLTVARVNLDPGALDDLTLTLQRHEQNWRLDQLEAGFGSGRITATAEASADPLEGLELEAQVTAEAIPVSLLRPWLPSAPIASGSLGTRFTARAAGTSPAELVAGLAGEGKVEGSFAQEGADGAAYGADGGRLNSERVNGERVKGDRVQGAILPSLLAEMDSHQLWFSGQLSAEEGRIKTPDLQLVGDAQRMVARGVLADLPLRRADLDILLYGQEKGGTLKEMNVAGPLDRLRFRVRQGANGAGRPAGEAVMPAPAASGAAYLPHGP